MRLSKPLHLVAEAYALLVYAGDDEAWFTIDDERLPDAHAACEQGLLDKRWCHHCGALNYRCSDHAIEIIASKTDQIQVIAMLN